MSTPEPTSLERALASARPHLDPAWSAERAEAVARAMRLTRRRRRVAGRLAVGAAAACLVVVLAALALRPAGSTSTLEGVQVTRVGNDSRLALLSLSDAVTRVALEHGGAWFDVGAARAPRTVTVSVGEVEVRFNSTHVLVERVSSGANVVVERGEAEVRWPGGSAHLRAGEHGSFPPPSAAAPAGAQTGRPAQDRAARGTPEDGAETGQSPREGASPLNAGSSTNSLAAQSPTPGQSPRGGAAPPGAGPNPGAARPGGRRPTAQLAPSLRPAAEPQQAALPGEKLVTAAVPSTPDIPPAALRVPRDEPAALLDLADAARVAGRPADALAPLSKLVQRHPGDPRAPLAAFTLGRVLLENLARPRDAAEAFAQARRLAPEGVLAEDALAREVEARARAGDRAAAKALATEYVARYPGGGRLKAVQRAGGLE